MWTREAPSDSINARHDCAVNAKPRQGIRRLSSLSRQVARVLVKERSGVGRCRSRVRICLTVFSGLKDESCEVVQERDLVVT